MRLHPKVFVYTYVRDEAILAGEFACDSGVGRFAYRQSYIEHPHAHSLDPINLPLRPEPFLTQADGGYFGAMLDCCPQEWGRRVVTLVGSLLMKRGFAVSAEAILQEGLQDPHNTMILGSGFGTGSLRFGYFPDMQAEDLEPTPAELNMNGMGSLAEIARVLARAEDNAPLSEEEQAWLLPGVSLGGARPKALVAVDNELWIAKFFRPREIVDIQRVELAVNSVARAAGINVAECRAEVLTIDGLERTIFLTKRFDRRLSGTPVHYLSAATLLGAPRSVHTSAGAKVDVADSQSRYSYMDIAQVVRRICGTSVASDCEQLYRRMVFNALIGNRDDHLCNHGFLLEPRGSRYCLSPAFDLALTPNATPYHPINLGDHGRVPTVSNLLSRCGAFGLTRPQGVEIISHVNAAVGLWPQRFMAHEVGDADRAWVSRLVMDNVPDRLREASRKSRPAAAYTGQSQAAVPPAASLAGPR